MRKLLPGVAALAALASASPAMAEGWIVRADAGLAIGGGLETPSADLSIAPDFGGEAALENAYSWSLAVGRDFNGPLRLEAEYTQHKADLEASSTFAEGGNTRARGFMLNAYYDLPAMGVWRPFVGGGVGSVEIDADARNVATLPNDNVSFDDTMQNWAFQFMAGTGVALTDDLTLDVGYRYFTSPDARLGGFGPSNTLAKYDVSVNDHAAFFGFRWRIGG